MIVCLRHSGIPIEALIDYAEMLRQGDDTLDAREDLLKEQLANLEEKRHNLDRSIKRLKHKISLDDYRIEYLRDHLKAAEVAIENGVESDWLY